MILLGYQRKCFTYGAVTPTMRELGLAKINLHSDDWRDPLDRARYLARAALAAVFGAQAIAVEALAADDKTVQYSSDLAGSA